MVLPSPVRLPLTERKDVALISRQATAVKGLLPPKSSSSVKEPGKWPDRGGTPSGKLVSAPRLMAPFTRRAP